MGDIEVSKYESLPLIAAFSALAAFGAVAAGSIPALAYWDRLMPPKWNGSEGISLAVAIVACFIGYFVTRKRTERSLTKVTWRAFVGALVVLGSYLPLLDYLTVSPPPPRSGDAMQIGFGLRRWSLTQRGLDAIDGKLDDARPPNSPQELMKTFGVWSNQNPIDAVWHRWSIITAGFLLDIVFFTGLFLWGIGVGFIIRILMTKAREAFK